MNNEINFSTKRLVQLQNETNKDIEYGDASQKGLFIRVSPSGTKTFRLKAWDRHRKKMTQMVLGHFPDLSIADARELATTMISDITKGVDLRARSNAIRQEQTLDQHFDNWIRNHAKQERSTWQEDISRYDLYIKGHLGSKTLSEITSDTIREWRAKLTQQKKQRGAGTISGATINRAFAIIRTIFNKCAPEAQNPCKTIRQFKETSRDKFLREDELQALFKALKDDNTPVNTRVLILLSLFTGARRSNILSMKWQNIDLNLRLWKIPANQSKNNEVMVLPLVDEVIDILQSRKKLSNSEYVFPSTGISGHLVEPKRAWKSLLKRAGLDEGFRLHDLRRTFGSYQAINGSSTKIIGASLGHKTEQSTAVYARLITSPILDSMTRAVAAMTREKAIEPAPSDKPSQP